MKGKRKKLKMALYILGGLLLLILLIVGGLWLRAKTRMGQLPPENAFAGRPNYQEGHFVNPEPLVHNIRRAGRRPSFFRHLFYSGHTPKVELPSVKPDFPEKPAPFALYWFGHSSLIFELGGARFATDPVFGNAAPLPWVVGRYCESPVKRSEIPPLEFVIITHDHYDHLEYETIRSFVKRKEPFVTPLGVGARLRGWGIAPERIHELGWGDSVTLAGVTITLEPSRHFSGRRFDDRDRTLWGSYIIEGGGRKIYHGADGGHGSHVKAIGDKYGPFDLVLLEIDAWNENWPNSHLFPADVILSFRELQGKRLLPVHWGVFDLAMHPWDESIREVTRLAEETAVPLVTPRMGERITPGVTPTGKWWEL